MVRYWGTMVAIRAPGAAPAGLERLLADAEPMVRLGAAQALLRRGDSAAAWQVIAECLAPKNSSELRLATLNVITLPSKWPAGSEVRAGENFRTGQQPVHAFPLETAPRFLLGSV